MCFLCVYSREQMLHTVLPCYMLCFLRVSFALNGFRHPQFFSCVLDLVIS